VVFVRNIDNSGYYFVRRNTSGFYRIRNITKKAKNDIYFKYSTTKGYFRNITIIARSGSHYEH
jgi:hypothetical protein